MGKVRVLKHESRKCRRAGCRGWAKDHSVLCSAHLRQWARSKKKR